MPWPLVTSDECTLCNEFFFDIFYDISTETFSILQFTTSVTSFLVGLAFNTTSLALANNGTEDHLLGLGLDLQD